MKITKKHIISFVAVFSFLVIQMMGVLMTQNTVSAGAALWDSQVGLGGEKPGVIGREGFSTGSERVSDIRTVAARIIQWFLGFLGIIFMALMVSAGFKWMNSQGNETAISEAKSQITAALIGLGIVVASYAITQLVMVFAVNVTYE